ncbi:MAG: hypothetical protein KKD86_02730, partial [Bacteroidetes bacterium]|nr:hypothetical protein [Bacteroidota bacterium]
MNIEQGISNNEVEIQIAFTSKFIIPCSIFDIQLSLTCYYLRFFKRLECHSALQVKSLGDSLEKRGK